MANEPPSIAVVAVVVLLVGTAVGAGAVSLFGGAAPVASTPATDGGTTGTDATGTERPTDGGVAPATDAGVARFESAAAFRGYRASAARYGGAPVRFVVDDAVARTDVPREAVTATAAATPTSTPMPTSVPTRTSTDGSSGDRGGAGASAGDDGLRHSETNVRETGIVEPDLVKTTGRTTYVVSHLRGGFEARRGDPDVTVLNTSTPATPEAVAEIGAGGQLLRHDDTLLVLSNDGVRAFDVSEPSAPEPTWERDVPGRIEAARLQAGRLYLVTATRIGGDEPCPVRPLGDTGPAVPCEGIYHPVDPAPADVTYTAVALDPSNGTAAANASFVGSHDAVVYTSADGLYLTYADRTDRARAFLGYVLSTQRDRLPGDVLERLERLKTFDLHSQALQAEVRATLEEHYRTLDRDERERLREDIREGWRDYRVEHRRDLQRTGIVRFSLPDLELDATGSVPGRPLDTFSLDERDGRLRIATTVDAPGSESVNDLYVLDGNLSVAGRVTGMGEGQRVYAVRFVGERAYVVTFRQVDPLHVVDLSAPEDPTLRGELTLPGFSSYLHPLGPDRILGVGEEEGRVKAVVFDVSDPDDPTVASSLTVDERWNAVRESHHAFLLDRRHEVFFLPGREGAHVVSYGDGLSVETEVEVRNARRAAYVGDSMYVVGGQEVVVLDERTWERTATVEL